MKIVEIRGFNLSFPLAEPMGNALNLFRKRDALVVQVVTDTGLTGWGESGNSPHAAAAFIRARLAGLILGKSPLEIGRHFQAMCGAVGYDRRGAAMMAISAIDVALHDVVARMHGISVAALLGGAVRDEVLAYASGAPSCARSRIPIGSISAKSTSTSRAISGRSSRAAVSIRGRMA